ncbi:MAG: hypothetical protein ACKKMV_00270 [Candidatus Nealsonbacteria bacterium]
MTKWDYKTIRLNNTDEKKNEAKLKTLGMQDWELVAVTDNWPETAAIAYLKKKMD